MDGEWPCKATCHPDSPDYQDCLDACDEEVSVCLNACAAQRETCDAWAEATHGTGGEPEDPITPTCRVGEVTVWINAFIPGDLPGLTLDRPGHPGETMLPDVPGPWACFLTDQRGFSNDIGKSARLHQEVIVDLDAGQFRTWEDVGHTME